jgi:hypothetical protein
MQLQLQQTQRQISSSTSTSTSTDDIRLDTSTSTSTYDDHLHVPSYNEVILEHRQERVPRWRRLKSSASSTTNTSTIMAADDSDTDASVPIHTLCQILQRSTDLQALAENYQWNERYAHCPAHTHGTCQINSNMPRAVSASGNTRQWAWTA